MAVAAMTSQLHSWGKKNNRILQVSSANSLSMIKYPKASKSIPIYQCSLSGLIPRKDVSKLLERIVGLCGFVLFDGKVNLFSHEIVYESECT